MVLKALVFINNKIFLFALLSVYTLSVAMSYVFSEPFRYFDEALTIQRTATFVSKEADDFLHNTTSDFQQATVPAGIAVMPLTGYFFIRKVLCKKQEVVGIYPCVDSYAAYIRGLFGGSEYYQHGHASNEAVDLQKATVTIPDLLRSERTEYRELGTVLLISRSCSVLIIVLTAGVFFFFLCRILPAPLACLVVSTVFSGPQVLKTAVLSGVPATLTFAVALTLFFLLRIRVTYRVYDLTVLLIILWGLQFIGIFGPAFSLLGIVSFLIGVLVDSRNNSKAALPALIGFALVVSGTTTLLPGALQFKALFAPLNELFASIELYGIATDARFIQIGIPAQIFFKLSIACWINPGLIEALLLGVLFFLGAGVVFWKQSVKSETVVVPGLSLFFFWLSVLFVILVRVNNDWDWLYAPVPVLFFILVHTGFVFLLFELGKFVLKLAQPDIPENCAPERFARELLEKTRGELS